MIYDDVDDSIKVKNRCNWYKFGEKSSKFFLNPGKCVDAKMRCKILYQKIENLLIYSK